MWLIHVWQQVGQKLSLTVLVYNELDQHIRWVYAVADPAQKSSGA
jgi:hypothetical protein